MIDLMLYVLKTSLASSPLIYHNSYHERNRSKEIFFAIAVLQISQSLHVHRDTLFAAIAHVGPEATLPTPRHAHTVGRDYWTTADYFITPTPEVILLHGDKRHGNVAVNCNLLTTS
jgi:hypothetical protein